MKGIPTKDGWCVMREDNQPMECVELWTGQSGKRYMSRMRCENTPLYVVGESTRFDTAEFFPIPPPPDDCEYACVWVQVQREQGKRTCHGCKLFGECDKAEVLKIMTVYKHDDPHYFAPGPDCPLGSD